MICRIAIYLRLSIEDKRIGLDGLVDESNSITSQRKLLMEFIEKDAELAAQEVLEFCDDGISGTRMDRPGVQEMLNLVKKGQIGCILVKDMSRFSRDYIELGTYLNQIFPFMGVRFISVNDHYDSRKHEGTTFEIDTAFRTLLYDLYSKDLSVKVRASFQSKREQGEYITGVIPLGYERSREKKNVVVVNEREAGIVRWIFALAADGLGSVQIARRLIDEQTPTPMELHYPGRKPKNENYNWTDKMVRNILKNRFYLGEMIYGKTRRDVVGREGKSVPEDQWKVIPNHHEALVTSEVFERVQKRYPKNRSMRKRERYVLTGRVFCGGCGYAMSYRGSTKYCKSHALYCAKYAQLRMEGCCTYFNPVVLSEIVLKQLYEELMKRGDLIQQREIMERSVREWRERLNAIRREVREQSRVLSERKKTLYKRYAAGEVTAEEYRLEADGIDQQIRELSEKQEKTEEEYKQVTEVERRDKEDMKQIIRFSHMEELTQEAVEAFVKRVTLHKDKRVEIEWNFAERAV